MTDKVVKRVRRSDGPHYDVVIDENGNTRDVLLAPDDDSTHGEKKDSNEED